jgi:hypothetical protein
MRANLFLDNIRVYSCSFVAEIPVPGDLGLLAADSHKKKSRVVTF